MALEDTTIDISLGELNEPPFTSNYKVIGDLNVMPDESLSVESFSSSMTTEESLTDVSSGHVVDWNARFQQLLSAPER